MKNSEMANAIEVMSTLHETGRLGYAIARNLRILKTECTEYLNMRNDLVQTYGEQVGNQFRIRAEKIKEFTDALGDIPNIEHDVNIFKVSEEEFFGGTLTSDQMEALLFMVEEGEA